MIKYVILTGNITNMGGAQQYLNNKIKRLKNASFDPIIISTREGKCLLKELSHFYQYRIPDLKFRPCVYSKKDTENILIEISNMIGDVDEEVWVESNGVAFIEWAELLAERFHGKHVCINLQENHNYDSDQKKMFLFKYNRNELLGISKRSIPQILGSWYENGSYAPYIKAECHNVVEDVDCPLIEKITSSDYNLGIIGRLDKGYICEAVRGIVDYSRKYPNKQFNLIVIGGGKDGEAQTIQDLVSKVGNVTLIITGYMVPIPRNLINRIDCFISSAGSARVSMEEGKPTISMSADTCKTIGILNYTTRNSLFLDDNDDQEYNIPELLDMILVDNFCGTHPDLGMEKDIPNYEIEFNNQISYFSQDNGYAYYDVSVIKPNTSKEKIIKLLMALIGRKRFIKIYENTQRRKSKGNSSEIG